jgi:hypothetical protein
MNNNRAKYITTALLLQVIGFKSEKRPVVRSKEYLSFCGGVTEYG